MKASSIFTQFALLVCLFSCSNSKEPESRKEQAHVFAREPNDSADYRYVKESFYENKAGQLFERKLMMARDKDSSCRCEFLVYYDNDFRMEVGDSDVLKPLETVVDIASFAGIDSTEFSKDKNHVYYFYANSGGGSRVIITGADAATFKRLCEYRWGIDKNAVFYQSSRLEGLNVKKIQLFYTDSTHDFVDYIKDDKKVFRGAEWLEDVDVKTFDPVAYERKLNNN